MKRLLVVLVLVSGCASTLDKQLAAVDDKALLADRHRATAGERVDLVAPTSKSIHRCDAGYCMSRSDFLARQHFIDTAPKVVDKLYDALALQAEKGNRSADALESMERADREQQKATVLLRHELDKERMKGFVQSILQFLIGGIAVAAGAF